MKKNLIAMMLLGVFTFGSNVFAEEQEQEGASDVKTSPVTKISDLPIMPTAYQKEVAKKAAFNKYMEAQEGFSKEQILEIGRTQREKKMAEQQISFSEANSESRTITISPNSAKQEIIRLSYGNNTILQILDSYGNPWTVENISLPSEVFNFHRFDGSRGSIIQLSTTQEYARGNVAFLLAKGQGAKATKIPVVLDLESGGPTYDRRVVLRVEGLGDNAAKATSQEVPLPTGADGKYMAWLDGVVPSTVQKVTSSDPRVEAYRESDGSIVLIMAPASIYLPQKTSGSIELLSSDGTRNLFKLGQKNATVVRYQDLNTGAHKKVILSGF